MLATGIAIGFRYHHSNTMMSNRYFTNMRKMASAYRSQPIAAKAEDSQEDKLEGYVIM